MTIDLEQRLREAFHDDARRARLVNPDAPPAPQVRSLSDEQHPRRLSRKLVAAVAAAAAVLGLIGALAQRDDDQNVDTTPVTEPPVVLPMPRTIFSGPGCPIGIAGDPIELLPGPELMIDDLGGVDPGIVRFDTESGQGVAHTLVGEQVVEFRVPGFELTDTEGWRIEDIDLDRGPATLWLDGPPSGVDNKPFVQVRYFPGSEEPCSSFTVTVDGGTEAANGQTAIDFAERVVLPGEHADLPMSDPSVTTTVVPQAGPVDESLALPEPGEQPADPAAAEEQVRAAFIGIFDFSRQREERAQLSERPAVWADANRQLVERHGEIVEDLHAEVDEVVFTSPTHAAVRFRHIASDPGVPRGPFIGDAVLVDGRWLVAITTTCERVAVAGVTCDMTL